MQQTFPIHPLAEAFPLIEGVAFAELVASIGEYGLREPITLLDGAVLDGRNRLRACEVGGVKPRFETFTGSNPAAFVIDKNINRRHLNESQRGMIAAKLSNIASGVNKRFQEGAPSGVPAITVPEAARLLNVGPRTVNRARTILAKGTPEDVAQVESGHAAVTTVADQILQGVPTKKRRNDSPTTTRQKTHQLRSDLWHQFKDALLALTGMPHVDDAVAIIRSQDRNGFIAEKLPLATDYLKDFQNAWNSAND